MFALSQVVQGAQTSLFRTFKLSCARIQVMHLALFWKSDQHIKTMILRPTGFKLAIRKYKQRPT